MIVQLDKIKCERCGESMAPEYAMRIIIDEKPVYFHHYCAYIRLVDRANGQRD